MDYITRYYKTLSEDLQRRFNLLEQIIQTSRKEKRRTTERVEPITIKYSWPEPEKKRDPWIPKDLKRPLTKYEIELYKKQYEQLRRDNPSFARQELEREAKEDEELYELYRRRRKAEREAQIRVDELGRMIAEPEVPQPYIGQPQTFLNSSTKEYIEKKELELDKFKRLSNSLIDGIVQS